MAIRQTKINVSLKCPINRRRITVPARGDDCRHIQCFDLESYLKLNAERGYFSCPVCGIRGVLSLLKVDEYMWGILTSLERVERNSGNTTETEEIVIYPNGQWNSVSVELEIEEEVREKTIGWTGIAWMVWSTLDRIIENIRSTHPSFKGMRYKFGLKCDLCRDKTNEPCERHNVKACSCGDCVHILDLKSLRKPLDHCKNNLLALNISNLHESAWVKATVNESERRSHPEDEQIREQKKKMSLNESTDKGCEASTTDDCSSHSSMNVSINDLAPLVRRKLCRKLNIGHVLGGDYRDLAALLGMTNDDISLISQGENGTESVLKWAERHPKITIGKLKQILLDMDRDDCVEIIDKQYESA